MGQQSEATKRPSIYRATEMETLTRWVRNGVSGSVVGLVGCGRSNLLRFLCDPVGGLGYALPPGKPSVALVPVDLYDLPSDQIADLYRTLLHAFYWVREQLPPPLGQTAYDIYMEHRATTDAFLAQKALYEVVLAFQKAGVRIVLVLNRFDRFCETSTPRMVNTMRSLRDRFKETLSYIVGMRQEVAYLPEPMSLGDMYELFDAHICYVGALGDDDRRAMLGRVLRAAPSAPDGGDIAAMLRLSGGFPSLVRAVGQWWMLTPRQPYALWRDLLLEDGAVVYRLERMWQGLTQEEKLALAEVLKQSATRPRNDRGEMPLALPGASPTRALALVQRLAAKGCCFHNGSGWQINGELLAAFVASNSSEIRGSIWLDAATQMVYQGQHPIIGLTPLELSILRFLLTYPRIRHTSDAIIEHAWPQEENKEAISPNNLQVHISGIRKKIEPHPATPRFLVTWHGRPGGYQLFPEGKPT